MTHKTICVANSFLKKSFIENKNMNAMKLQKLVYFMNGWFLAITDKPVIFEPFEVWKYGPTIPSLYLYLKEKGLKNIKEYIYPYSNFDGGAEIVSKEDKEFYDVFDVVWNKYVCFDELLLASLANKEGTPFYYCKRNNIDIIPSELIKEYFLNYIKNGRN